MRRARILPLATPGAPTLAPGERRAASPGDKAAARGPGGDVPDVIPPDRAAGLGRHV